mmetsp:Transcript_45552/g.143071  ORF Transcript_45552/g.143071 Transcript_45552/m.143071 type:complete len:215 (-) Transcript_45552:3-647(-)
MLDLFDSLVKELFLSRCKLFPLDHQLKLLQQIFRLQPHLLALLLLPGLPQLLRLLQQLICQPRVVPSDPVRLGLRQALHILSMAHSGRNNRQRMVVEQIDVSIFHLYPCVCVFRLRPSILAPCMLRHNSPSDCRGPLARSGSLPGYDLEDMLYLLLNLRFHIAPAMSACWLEISYRSRYVCMLARAKLRIQSLVDVPSCSGAFEGAKISGVGAW